MEIDDRIVVERLAQEAHLFHEVSRIVSSGLELEEVLQGIAEAVCRLSVWKRCSIAMADPDEGDSRVIARYPPIEEEPENKTVPRSISTTVRAIREGLIVVPDALSQDEYPDILKWSRIRGFRSLIVAPLHLDQAPGGAIWLYDVQRTFDEEDIRQAQTIADQVTVAIRTARLLQSEREMAAKLERLLDIQTKLLEHVVKGSSLSSLVEIVSAAAGNPAIVVDQLMHPLAHAAESLPSPNFHEHWENFIEQMTDSPTLRRCIATEMSSRSRGGVDNITLEPEALQASVPGRILVRKLGGTQQVLGYLVLLDLSRPFDNLDHAVARVGGLAIEVELMRRYSIFLAENRVKTDVLRMLFDGRWSERSDVLERSSHLGVDLQAENGLVFIRLRLSIEPERETNENEVALFERIFQRLSPMITDQFPGAAAVSEGTDILIIGPAQSQRLIAGWVANVLNQWLDDEALVLIGPVCTRFEDYQRARVRCDHALKIASMLGKAGVVSISELGEYQFLVSIENSDELQFFLEQSLGPIEEYDRQRSTDLMLTLDTYFANNCVLQRTADDLFIHVSTLRYRLEQIEDIAHIDLSSPDTRFSLQLALRLRLVYRRPS